jgi:hypothetical protein
MPSFWLEFDQNGAIQRYPFDRPSLSMGRERTCDFHLDHPTVSRQHAMIVHDPRAGFKLLVMSKSGMTAVDGAQVQGELPIYDGARLNIGQMAFTFRSQDPSAQRAPMGGMGGGMGMGAPTGGGFGQPPASGGFGQLPAAGGFGQPPAGGGFGQPPAAGGFGQPPAGAKPPVGNTAAQAAVGGGVASWDEIAAGAESEEEEVQRNMTDFERIEQASAKATTKTEGTNPILLVLVVLAAVGVGYVFLMPPEDSGQINMAPADEQVPVQIKVDCLGKDDCTDKAKNAYKVATQTLEKSDVTVSNLFESYKKFLETKQYIEKSGAAAPKGMDNLDDKIKETRAGLDVEFKKYRAAFHNAKTYKMYGDMAKALTSIKAVFPDKTAYEYKWATEQEGKMKGDGTYPAR